MRFVLVAMVGAPKAAVPAAQFAVTDAVPPPHVPLAVPALVCRAVAVSFAMQLVGGDPSRFEDDDEEEGDGAAAAAGAGARHTGQNGAA